MIRKIRGSILLKLSCIIAIIVIILSSAMFASRSYVSKVVTDSSVTLCESLLRQANNTLSLYEDNLRYSASYLCRYSLIEKLSASSYNEEGTDDATLLQLSSYFSQIVSENREIVSALLFRS